MYKSTAIGKTTSFKQADADADLPKDKHKGCVANTALKMIQAIYTADKAFAEQPPEERLKAERTIRSFCVGKKNWMFIDTISGAKSSAIIYSIVEIVKANYLKPYHYFDYMLSSFANHMDDLEARDYSFIDNLLPWSDELPAECRKIMK